MSATATLPRATSTPERECRRCRAARSIGRIALFVAGGVLFALALSWIVARVPVLGAVLGVAGVLLLVRSLVRLFTTTSPVQAATQLGIALGIGALVSVLTALIVR